MNSDLVLLITGFEETGKHSMEGMLKAKKFAYWWGGVFTVLTLVAWPLLALPAGAPLQAHKL